MRVMSTAHSWNANTDTANHLLNLQGDYATSSEFLVVMKGSTARSSKKEHDVVDRTQLGLARPRDSL